MQELCSLIEKYLDAYDEEKAMLRKRLDAEMDSLIEAARVIEGDCYVVHPDKRPKHCDVRFFFEQRLFALGYLVKNTGFRPIYKKKIVQH